MNRLSILAFALTLVLALGARVQSQSVVGAKSVLQQLQALKATNQTLLDKQTALMLKLDEMQKQAAQMRFMVKRG
jgi:cell division protein FtsB